ncbi:hypothetical protein MTR_7g028650 [Medicago truncatula]|uniref:Uncharacterized protein n=1 Tax=Medicago truncatula TaxID=3880 RepID=G7L388_MEDTR|nr:hypothetical protein MTR_7g028650 [Medicago truncatula]
MQVDMKEQKLSTEAVKAQLMEVTLVQKHQNEIQTELIRKQEELERKMQEHHEESLRKQVQLAKEQVELEKKQHQTNDEIDVILEMMKKQQQP